MSRQTILMCRPDFFKIKYEINPWMKGNVVDQAKAMKQWEALYSLISNRAEVKLVEATEDTPDLVFCANAGLVIGNKVIVSRFFHPERQTEEPLYAAWFESAGFELIRMPDNLHFEGAGDALYDRRMDCLWAAYGPRSKKESYTYVGKYVDMPIRALKLVNQKFYHIDTCFCPLQDGKLIYYSKAFDDASRKLIEDLIPAEDRHDVTDEDAMNFACNAVDLRDAVVFHKISEPLAKKVKTWGFAPLQTSLSEFLKAGGSAKCLTLDVSR